MAVDEYARSRRNVYPRDVEEGIRAMSRELRAQLRSVGTTLEDLASDVHATAKTTLLVRGPKGTLTMKDMLMISRYFEIDWTAVVEAGLPDMLPNGTRQGVIPEEPEEEVKPPREPKPVKDLKEEPESVQPYIEDLTGRGDDEEQPRKVYSEDDMNAFMASFGALV